MDKAVRYELPLGSGAPPTEGAPPLYLKETPKGRGGLNHISLVALRVKARLLRSPGFSTWVKAVFMPRPPSLVIFSSVAVTGTLFVGLLTGLASAQISGDPSITLKWFLLVMASLPIALVTTIFLSVVLPLRTFASAFTLVAILSSYSPYVLGAATGMGVALWLGKLLPFGYDGMADPWKWTIAGGSPVLWLLIGAFSNHLSAVVERRREYEKGMDELRESRHRIMLVHEQTRKEIAGVLHGRVQSRMVVLGHWLNDCQEHLKSVPDLGDGPREMVEKLENASKLLQEIRDQELRSITRQLYPSIIHAGLPSALNSLADRFRSIFNVELDIHKDVAELESPLRPSLHESVRLTLYRVAEEALSNVAKYSQAEEARISLSLSSAIEGRASGEVMLVIQDNGLGFDPSAISPGQGLLSMDDYVAALGGTLEVRSAPGVGTTIVASVPVSYAEYTQPGPILVGVR